MRLIHDGEAAYHPATGLDLVPGEHDYPEQHADALQKAGLRPVKPAKVRASAEKGE